MSFIIVQDWSLRKQISESSCKEFSLDVKVLGTESSYLNSRVIMLYCHTMMLYHSVILLYHSVVLLYLLYDDPDNVSELCRASYADIMTKTSVIRSHMSKQKYTYMCVKTHKTQSDISAENTHWAALDLIRH